MKNFLSLLVASLLILAGKALAQSAPTIGLMSHERGCVDSGYVLFAPQNDSTFLIDMCGKLVHVWPSTQRGNGLVYMLEEGSLLRGGRGAQGGSQIDATTGLEYVAPESLAPFPWKPFTPLAGLSS